MATNTTAPTTSANPPTSTASVSTSISESLTTSYSTVTLTSSTSTIPVVSTSSSLIIISTTSIPPSTTIVPAPTSITTPDSTSVIAVTSVVTESPSYNAGTTAPAVIYTITSTLPQVTTTPTAPTSSQSPSSTSAAPSALSASGESTSSSGALTSGAKIAIAVIIPVVVIAAAFIFGLWFWKRRKARRDAKELRKSEMAEYGFNPNDDPSLVPVAATYPDEASEAHEDNSGYRGWGTTSTGRKASTTLGSNSRHLNGPAMSDSGSQPGGYTQQASPNGQGSDHYSADPLMNDHPESGDGVGALGGVAAAGAVGAAVRTRNSQVDIHRGPSNASSAYSTGRPQSEASSDAPAVPGGTYYQEEVPYNIYNDAQPQHGPYGDGTYGGGNGQPVIRDVQARRNTRIERAPTFPQTQGGIAQNF